MDSVGQKGMRGGERVGRWGVGGWGGGTDALNRLFVKEIGLSLSLSLSLFQIYSV